MSNARQRLIILNRRLPMIISAINAGYDPAKIGVMEPLKPGEIAEDEGWLVDNTDDIKYEMAHWGV